MATVKGPTRTCSVCKEIKPLDSFYRDRTKNKLRSYRCFICDKKITSRYKKKNPEVSRRSSEKYRINNKEKINKYQKSRYRKISHLLEQKRLMKRIINRMEKIRLNIEIYQLVDRHPEIFYRDEDMIGLVEWLK